jgi:acetyltransferase-like isoleucine patch superfamily enzyme
MSVKKFLLKIIKYIPHSEFKNSLYRNLFGYKIGEKVTIGKSFIYANKVEIGDNVFIANKNTFSCGSIKIGSNTSIHSGNLFIGGSVFTIGNKSRIINNHYFDLWNSIAIGNNTWVAGKNSEFWTHGSTHTKTKNKDLSIIIGNDIYIGSSTKMAAGTKINDINLIGLGSVVSGEFKEKQTIIAGNPAKVVKNQIDWRVNW